MPLVAALVALGITTAAQAEPAAPRLEAAEVPRPAASTSGDRASSEGARSTEPVDLGALWQQAQSRMATSDYDEAIALLTRVYDAIATDPDAATLRLRVQWALHQAHLGSYGVDGDLEHLYIARDLLRKYREALPANEDEQRSQADEAMVRVQAKIDEQEAERAAVAEAAAAEARRIAAAEAAEQTEPTPVETAPHTPLPVDEPRAHLGLVIGGSVGVGLGLVGLGLMAGGLGSSNAAIGVFETDPEQRDQARDDIRRGNTIGIVGAVTGGVLLAAGSVVLALGLRRRAASRSSLAAGPGQVGVGWRLRF